MIFEYLRLRILNYSNYFELIHSPVSCRSQGNDAKMPEAMTLDKNYRTYASEFC